MKETPIPQVKALQLKANLLSLPLLGDDDARAVCELFGADRMQEIRRRTNLAWLPLEYDVRLSECVVECCGFERAVGWCHEATLVALNGPLVRNLVRPTLRLFGAQPQSLARIAPVVLGQLLRHCGTFSVGGFDASSMTICGAGLPELMTEGQLYAEGFGYVFSAACTLVDVSTLVRTVRLGRGRVEWRLQFGVPAESYVPELDE